MIFRILLDVFETNDDGQDRFLGQCFPEISAGTYGDLESLFQYVPGVDVKQIPTIARQVAAVAKCDKYDIPANISARAVQIVPVKLDKSELRREVEDIMAALPA